MVSHNKRDYCTTKIGHEANSVFHLHVAAISEIISIFRSYWLQQIYMQKAMMPTIQWISMLVMIVRRRKLFHT